MTVLPALPPLANHLGFLALTAYAATLWPTIIRVVFPAAKTQKFPKFLRKRRRAIGIISFILALGHIYFVIRKRNFDFFDFKTYLISFEGTATFIILTLLTITSNNWSIKHLKQNWKRLHTLTYWAMFLLVWHILSKMQGQWTAITPLGKLVIITTAVFFGVRKWNEFCWSQARSKAHSKGV
ncbi:MAG: ferric reductase-like transmembrane domain-containing protein [Elainellaceae cyanobacterium]